MQAWQVTPFIYLYLGAVAMSLALFVAAWRRRPPVGATYFNLLALSSAVWILGYLLGFFNTDLGWKLAMLRIEFLGAVTVNFSWLLFVAAYAQYDRWINRRNLILLAVVPGLTLLQVLFVDWHDFFYRSYGVTTRDGLVISSKVYGPGFALWVAWSYLVFIVANFMLIHRTLTMPRHLRGVSGILVLIILVLFVSHSLYLSDNNPIAPYDPTPLSFAFASLFFMVAMRAHRFLDIVPIAHELVFETIDAGILIADARGVLMEANPTAERWLDHPEREIVGEAVVDLISEWKPPATSEVDKAHEIRLAVSGKVRVVEMRTTPMLGRGSRHRGHVILLHDISQGKELEGEQQRLIGELQDALAQIKTLHGLLPICAHCKRIREDDGSWIQIEVYIRDRSDANFSHGICPECHRTIYPEVARKE